ncbi:MAG: hypothetical protein M1840_006460 [Geoglossum simile]|nr:MAG: hypothetical protein M1840_006460 [Geoglossum simile]
MPPVSDLVRDSKLETNFGKGYTQHVYYVSGITSRQRKMRTEVRWERRRNLGTGSFGTVWLEKLMSKNGGEDHRAVKEIRKGVQRSLDYSRELEVIAKFSHQKYERCFVKSFGWYESPESVFIAMEYFPLGDLQNYLSPPLPENAVQQITSQILEGLSFMHDNGFAHRDLKPSNILVKSKNPDWWVKIGDFGMSKRAEEGQTALRTFGGTPGFLAPEILAKFDLLEVGDFEVGEEYSVAVDIWSLGELSFRALTGGRPFPRSLGAYISGASPFPMGKLRAHGVSKEGCDFLSCLMAPMPKDRLTARDALSHIWIESQSPPSTRVSTEMQRSSPLSEGVVPSLEYPTEASARWSSVTTPKSNTLTGPSPAGESPAIPQPKEHAETQQITGGAVCIKRGQHDEAEQPDGKLVTSTSQDGTAKPQDTAVGIARREVVTVDMTNTAENVGRLL